MLATSSHGNVKVLIRVRPFSEREVADGAVSALRIAPSSIAVLDPLTLRFDGAAPSTLRLCEADAVLAPGSQEDVFAAAGEPLLESTFSGFNAALFAYGPTGTGKTFTMLGGGGGVWDPAASHGIIPRLCDALFAPAQGGRPALVRVMASFYQVYCESVSDLLAAEPAAQAQPPDPAPFSVRVGSGRVRSQQQQQQQQQQARVRRSSGSGDTPSVSSGGVSLRVREHPVSGPYVDGLTLVPVASFADVEKLLVAGSVGRRVAETALNAASSRSHAVFTLHVTTRQAGQGEGSLYGDPLAERTCKLVLVDLAGEAGEGRDMVGTKDVSKEGVRVEQGREDEVAPACVRWRERGSGRGRGGGREGYADEPHLPMQRSLLLFLTPHPPQALSACLRASPPRHQATTEGGEGEEEGHTSTQQRLRLTPQLLQPSVRSGLTRPSASMRPSRLWGPSSRHWQ